MTSEATDYFIDIADDPCEFMVTRHNSACAHIDDIFTFWLTREATFTC
jgi:hypothetical protein